MKDAKGHGSNARGVADQHQHRIAVDTVKNPLKGTFLGGPNAAEAEATLRGKYGYTDSMINKLKAWDNEPKIGGPGMKGSPVGSASSDYWAAKSLAQYHPKSETPEPHPSMAGGQSVVPRDVAARFAAQRDAKDRADRGFRSGMREINRLKRQGK